MADTKGKAVDSALVRGYTAKILKSSIFLASKRMRRFLQFAVESALAGHEAELKEYVLGIEVFDRAMDSFDPRIDPIVRVEARRLRSKLKAYYQSEGRGDRVIIDMPSGAYVPHIRLRATGLIPLPLPDASARPTIVVMPFTDLDANQETEYFSQGLTEELIHALTNMDGLRVIAARDRLGTEFDGTGLLEGSVRTSGNRVRVMVRFIDTATGYYIWSESYDRHIEEILEIQDEISRAIVTTCRSRLATESARARTADFRGDIRSIGDVAFNRAAGWTGAAA